MKRAVLYARVSSDLQKKERTIESQIVELKRQIGAAGDVLVQDYVDDGYSGAQLNRPALDRLRSDLKTPHFDTIYFLNTDRIARDVTYQTIIISEILKHRKQIIINGKDYVHNPENKFTLTVLGAVAELERAKMIERVTRGKQLRLAQGCLLGAGCNMYGYDYLRRTAHTPAQYAINQAEAAVVQYVFSEYGKGQVGLKQITRSLENQGVLTKTGKTLWRTTLLKCMLRNAMYTGIRYFNTMRLMRDNGNPFEVSGRPRTWLVPRDRAEWVGIKVPAIIPQALFDQVQKRLEWNRNRYRNPKETRLLSCLIRCGRCGGSFSSYRRWYTDKRGPSTRILHKVAKLPREAASAGGVCSLAFCIQGRITGADKMARRQSGGAQRGSIVLVPGSLVAAE